MPWACQCCREGNSEYMMDNILRIDGRKSGGPEAVFEPLGSNAEPGECALVASDACEEQSESCHPLGPESLRVPALGMLCCFPAGIVARALASLLPLALRKRPTAAGCAGPVQQSDSAAIVPQKIPRFLHDASCKNIVAHGVLKTAQRLFPNSRRRFSRISVNSALYSFTHQTFFYGSRKSKRTARPAGNRMWSIQISLNLPQQRFLAIGRGTL